MKPMGGPKVTIRIVRADPVGGFTDLTTFPLARMWGIHEMQETAEGLRLKTTIRVEGILGGLWRKLVAQKIADEAPTQLASLALWARRLQ